MNKNGEYEVETLCLEDEDLKLFTGKESAGREQLTRAGIYEGPLFDYVKAVCVRRPDPCGGPVLGFYFPGENEMLSGADLCDRADLYLFFQGIPGGLCHADSLHYVTTSGGSIGGSESRI